MFPRSFETKKLYDLFELLKYNSISKIYVECNEFLIIKKICNNNGVLKIKCRMAKQIGICCYLLDVSINKYYNYYGSHTYIKTDFIIRLFYEVCCLRYLVLTL